MSDSAHLPRRILVGISCAPDGDPEAMTLSAADLHTFEHALWLAAKAGAELRLLHVSDFLDSRLAHNDPALAKSIQQSVGGQLEALAERAKGQGVDTHYAITSDKAWLALIKEAHQYNIGLIAASPRRETLRLGDRLLYGSTSKRLIQKAPCPVWIVDAAVPVGVRRVLALVDRTPASEQIVKAAGAIADATGAERAVLHCMEYPEDAALQRLVNAERATRQRHAEVQKHAKEFLQELTRNQAGWKLLLDNEWVVQAAPRVVARDGIDLVVMATASGSTLRGVLLGTTAERILEHATVSTWLVRPEGWESPLEL